ncbi:MAG: DUF721 domain-containing protein [Candidatus Kerfeldbacteria bacterium]|nr:DUF721 domain-containing protein [Candidatus Kerfeldbacteria bacterium]
MLSSLRALLGQSVARAGISAPVLAVRTRTALLDLVDRRWGVAARSRVTGTTLAEGRLEVSVDAPAFAQEFVNIRTTIMGDLNAALGTTVVHDLRVRVRRRSTSDPFTTR